MVVNRETNRQGFTLLETILIVGLLAGVYAYAVPQFGLFSGLERSSTLNRIAVDIRSAYDTAVLTGKVHRLVFNLSKGEYWLEVADRNNVYLGVAGQGRDLSKEEEEEQRLEFEESFSAYEDMLANPVRDPESDKEIALITPLVAAKKRLVAPKWSVIKNLEWQKRTVGPQLALIAMQAEHHEQKQSVEDNDFDGDELQAYLYFFPEGYVERAVIHLVPIDGDTIDRNATPYTVRTKPHEGIATVVAGREELDV